MKYEFQYREEALVEVGNVKLDELERH